MKESLMNKLTALGLTRYEAMAYLALMGRKAFNPGELASYAKVPRQRIYDVLAGLEDKGLARCHEGKVRTYHALAPKVGLKALAARRQEKLDQEKKHLDEESRLLEPLLAPLFHAGSGEDDPLFYVDVLTHPSRIAQTAMALSMAATKCVTSCIKPPLVLSREQNWGFLREALERGLESRAIYEKNALEDEELSAYIRTFVELGQEVRLVDYLPMKMNVFDDNTVLVSMQDPVGGEPRFTALAINHKGMVAMLLLAFERLWESGETFGD